MTAEAVVLNKSAVAMAADSAVSIPRGRSGSKIFDTANKLFELIKGRPVGVMIYSSAEMNGVPWETIIKSFRSECADFAGDTLEDYATAFVGYLSRSDCFLFTPDSELAAFDIVAFRELSRIAKFIRNELRSCMTNTGRIVQTRLSALVDRALVDVENTKVHSGPWTPLARAVFDAEYGPHALKIIDETFLPAMSLTSAQKRRITEIFFTACNKQFDLYDGSGIVIAGYGEREAFPSVYPLRIDGRLSGGVLRCVSDDPLVIDHDGPPGNYRTFAQDEMATQFVTGINNRTRREIVTYWSQWTKRAGGEMKSRVGKANRRLSEATLDAIDSEHTKLCNEGLQEFFDHMNDHQAQTFVLPLVNSIGYLPKDELAHMAETLVNLTSVIQRFSIHQDETVGGEIDVALISRGDGLVWLKRKHYFPLELNPAWPQTHLGITAASEG